MDESCAEDQSLQQEKRAYFLLTLSICNHLVFKLAPRGCVKVKLNLGQENESGRKSLLS